jgi:hypothetical protein
MMNKANKLTLANLGSGGLMEDADREFRKICENIADPNIPTDGVRTISITIKVKPDNKGQTAMVAYSVKSTMPGPEPGAATAWIAMEQGELGLYQMDLRQNELPFVQEPMVSEIVPVGTNKTAQMPPPAYAEPKKN